MNNSLNNPTVTPVFIGGTGRSGTTIFSKILEQSKQVYSYPQELRFITDPDGIISLKNALVNDWSKFQSDFAMERFLNLMDHLKQKYIGNYPNHSHSDIVGAAFYDDWISQLKNKTITYSIKSGWAARVNVVQKGLLKFFGRNQLTQSFLKESFYCTPLTVEQFNNIFGEFIQNFFGRTATINQAEIIIDHTPSNLIHFLPIKDMVPQAKLIHIYRDPRDVVCSYKSKDWGSTSIEQNAQWIEDVLMKWLKLKPHLSPESYIEVKFESLINNSKQEIKRICHFLNLPFEDSLLSLDLSNHNIGRWKSDLNSKEKAQIEDQLIHIIHEFGYQT